MDDCTANRPRTRECPRRKPPHNARGNPTLLDLTQLRDRAGRLTTFEYNPARQRTKTTDPLGRVLQFEPCSCGATKSLTDPMGRSTKWQYDLQGRTVQKTYADGTGTSFNYETRTSRLHERLDAKGQKTLFEYNADNTQRRISYSNAVVPTPPVAFIYDRIILVQSR